MIVQFNFYHNVHGYIFILLLIHQNESRQYCQNNLFVLIYFSLFCFLFSKLTLKINLITYHVFVYVSNIRRITSTQKEYCITTGRLHISTDNTVHNMYSCY
jgi:hypothetical protein